MSRFIMIVVFLGGLFYLYQKGNAPVAPMEAPPPPPAFEKIPAPVLSPEEIEKVRLATKDSEPQVRWAAIELLYRIHDPLAFKILEETLAIDTEAQVRRSALDLLKSSNAPGVTKNLLAALKDSEKDIRLAALLALGEQGDPSVAPFIVDVMRDVEPDVRLQAIHALGRIQEKRAQEYKRQQDLLKAEYQKALQRSQGPAPISGNGKFFGRTNNY